MIDFVGSEHTLEDTMKLFATSHLVIAPHGAALGFTAVMAPGSSVIELGYRDKKGDAKFPGHYFHTMITGSGLSYYFSMANGGYCKPPLTADVQDVIGLVEMATKSMLESSQW